MDVSEMQKSSLDKHRFMILLVIILFLLFISVFVHVLYGREIVYTHLFYLPIILAGLWYYRKAIYVGAFLGVFHIGLNFLQGGILTSSTIMRALIFCLIAYTVGTLAEKKGITQAALHEVQQEKALILQNLAEVVAYHNNEHRIIWANLAAGRSFNRDHKKIVGQKCYEVWHQRDAPCKNCPVTRALHTGLPQRSEIRSTDGRFWNITGSPVRDSSGKIIGAVETALEITEQKRVEEELQKLNLELEKRVKERTAELEALTRELDAFNYSVSHDLRAPLYSIVGFSQAVLEDHAAELDGQGLDYLHRVHAAGLRMGELIDDLLKLSRVTRMEMYTETIDLSTLASSYLTQLQQQEPHRQVETLISPGLIVQGDKSLLRIAIENLLDNAWKFTRNVAQPRIEFYASAENGQTVYAIRDNGAGFDPAYAEKIFAAFQRLHDQQEYSGTGIGLSIVSRIIERHGGEIWADGAVEQGATFSFTLNKPGEVRSDEPVARPDRRGF